MFTNPYLTTPPLRRKYQPPRRGEKDKNTGCLVRLEHRLRRRCWWGGVWRRTAGCSRPSDQVLATDRPAAGSSSPCTTTSRGAKTPKGDSRLSRLPAAGEAVALHSRAAAGWDCCCPASPFPAASLQQSVHGREECFLQAAARDGRSTASVLQSVHSKSFCLPATRPCLYNTLSLCCTC